MKRLILLIVICFISSSAFALKSECGKLIFGKYRWNKKGYPYHYSTWTQVDAHFHTHVLMQSSVRDTNGWYPTPPDISHLLKLENFPRREYMHILVKSNGQALDDSTYLVRGNQQLQNPAGVKASCIKSVAIGAYHL